MATNTSNDGTDRRKPNEYLSEEEMAMETEVPPWNSSNNLSVSPPRSVIDQSKLGEAPVEREAGMQILKAWQDLERKAARQEIHGLEEEEEEEEDQMFSTLEDDNDAVVLSRLTQKKEAGKEGRGDIYIENPPKITPSEEIKKPALVARGQSIPNSKATISERSGKRKQGEVKNHRRQESVEQAMFGLAMGRTDNRAQMMNSQTSQLFQDSPLLATEHLIESAQTRVQDLQEKQKKQKTHGRGHTLLDKNECNDGEEDEDEDLTDIINQDGDKEENDERNKTLNRIEEEEDSDVEEEELESQPGIDEESGRQKVKRRKTMARSVTTGVQQDWKLFQQF